MYMTVGLLIANIGRVIVEVRSVERGRGRAGRMGESPWLVHRHRHAPVSCLLSLAAHAPVPTLDDIHTDTSIKERLQVK